RIFIRSRDRAILADGGGQCISATRNIDSDHLSIAQHKPVPNGRSCDVQYGIVSDDITAFINRDHTRPECSRPVNATESAFFLDKTVQPLSIIIGAGDLTAVTDPHGGYVNEIGRHG